MAASRSIVEEVRRSKKTSELWKSYKRERALQGRSVSRTVLSSEAMSEEEKKTEAEGQPYALSGSEAGMAAWHRAL